MLEFDLDAGYIFAAKFTAFSKLALVLFFCFLTILIKAIDVTGYSVIMEHHFVFP
jgi:hypothetical protein